MITKEQILDEIKRTALANGGLPLGVDRFEKETGITSHEWGRHWARFGDAIHAAGFERNKFVTAYPDDFLILKLITLARKLGKFPTFREIQADKINDPGLPDKKSFQRLGTKGTIARKVMEYCKDKVEYGDVAQLCAPVLSTFTLPNGHAARHETSAGEVYLFKFGRYYKIGKTNDTVRRGRELRIQLPEKPRLIHSIKTDDPSGVETYWKNRFRSKMMNEESEFFDLDSHEIRAFKRWRRIY